MAKLMRCHYDVLGVEKTATPEEMKKAYRSLALRWHPDKNIDNLEEATRMFKDVQSAYTVLSDPQEKAWYDDHRDAILRGADPTSAEGAPETVNLWPYFSNSAFTSFDDSDPQGFYNVYAEVFQQIISEESLEKSALKNVPKFGSSRTPYSEVTAFYSYWCSFATKKTFAWCDEYNPNEAPNRQYRRAVEQENQKIRNKHKKEFNDLVRSLARFIKNRDKRVIEEQQKKQLADEKKRKEEEELRKQKEEKQRIERERAKKQRLAQLAEESNDSDLSEHDDLLQAYLYHSNNVNNKKSKKPQTQEDQPVSVNVSEDEEEEILEYFCAACNKTFKSEKQWLNHEKSKKHLENMAVLAELQEEEEGEDDNELSSEEEEQEQEIQEEQEEQEQEEQENEDQDQQSESEDEVVQRKDTTQKPETESESESESEGENDEDIIAMYYQQASKKQKGNNTKNNTKNKKNEVVQQPEIPAPKSKLEDSDDSETGEKEQQQQQQQDSKSKKKSRRRKPKDNQSEPSTVMKCNVCGLKFETRNQMFKHIKDSGHALHDKSNKKVPKGGSTKEAAV